MAAEKNFENKVKRFLTEQGCWYVKYFANGYTKTGIPDILACIHGRFVAIEVKAENGKPSELQLWNRAKIRESDGISIILYPSQFDEFKGFIMGMDTGLNYPFYYCKQYDFDKKGG